MASNPRPGQPTLSGTLEKLPGLDAISVQLTAFFDTPKNLYTTGVGLGQAEKEIAEFEGVPMTVMGGIGEEEFKDEALNFEIYPGLLLVKGEAVEFSVIKFFSKPGIG